jgi:SAM-dependent methyltransferase
LNLLKASHREYVGDPEAYDMTAALQFSLLTLLGLREHHTLLDIGCGSLRAGRLFIIYLAKGNYCGIEPNKWLVEEGMEKEIGSDLVALKQPTFSYNSDFLTGQFKQQFDYILAHSIFSHASQTQISQCLREAKKAMKPAAIIAATFREGTQNYKGDKWVYPDTVTYQASHMQTLIAQEELDSQLLREWPHPRSQTWILAYDKATPNPNLPNLITQEKLKQELAWCQHRLQKFDNNWLVKLRLKIKNHFRRSGDT